MFAEPSEKARSTIGSLGVAFECTGPSAAWCASVLDDLKAELNRRGVEVWRSDDASVQAPDATARLVLVPETKVMSIEVFDKLTNKQLAREFDPTALPEDGSALAAALAVEELLAASWAELSLSRDPPRTKPPVPSAQSEARAEIPKASPAAPAPPSPKRTTWIDLELGLTGELGDGLRPVLGPEISAGIRTERFRVALSLGLLRSFDHRVSNSAETVGTVRAELVPARVSFEYALLKGRSLRLAPLAALQSGYARVVGTSSTAYTTSTLDGVSGSVRIGSAIEWDLEPIFLRSEFGGGLTLVEFHPKVDGRPLAGLEGFFGWGSFGVGATF